MNSDEIQRDDSPALTRVATTVARRRETEYSVTWRIELTASSPRDAAKQAHAIQRDAKSLATVFDVCSLEDASTVRVDLAESADT